MIEENVVSSAGTVHHLTLDQIKRAIREAGLHPPPAQRLLRVHRPGARSGAGSRRLVGGRADADCTGGARLRSRFRGMGSTASAMMHRRGSAGSRDPARPDRETRVIHVEDLAKSFLDYQRGWVPAVARRHASTAIPGEIFGLLGPNGAGKTTTLRILSTVLKPTGGRAVVAGYDVVTEPEAVRPSIGYMSASTGIYDRMTAWELVEYFGRLYGLTARPAPRADGDDLRLAPDERLPRRAGLEDVDRHEAEGLDRPDDRPRSAGPDLRRADLGPRRPGAASGPAEDRSSCATRARRSSSRPTRCTRSRSSARGWRSSTRGRLQAEGTPEELLERFDQPDLEELFFSLVEQADDGERPPETGGSPGRLVSCDASTGQLPRPLRERD